MIDLFGNKIEEPIKLPKCKQNIGFLINAPKDKCCKICKHSYGRTYHNKTYYKCIFIGCSHGTATDIRLKNGCNKFEKEI